MGYSPEGVHPVRALYLHVPFCLRKCAYCDFASWPIPHNDPLAAAYAHTLKSQLGAFAREGFFDQATTAYVGGGTPTMLAPEDLGSLVRALRVAAPQIAELSCEANPESLSDTHLGELAREGATRLSLGVQSLHDTELKCLGRAHDAARAIDQTKAALTAGFDVSLDLMCAIPMQTASSWQQTLECARQLGVGHISVYPLQIEESTPLGDQIGEDEPAWHDPSIQAERMEAAETLLMQTGYRRYEVASYALAGKECHHNEMYWTGESYFALGTQAASMLDRVAYLQLREWCPQLPQLPQDIYRARLVCLNGRKELAQDASLTSLHYDLEFLTVGQACAEDLMLAMRMARGVDREQLGYARDVLGNQAVDAAVERVLTRGLATWHDGSLIPTHDGWLLGNELFGEFWGLAEGEVVTSRC